MPHHYTSANGVASCQKFNLNFIGPRSPDRVERGKILAGMNSGSTKRIYAQTDGDVTTFNEVFTPGGDRKKVEIGKKWFP